MIEKEWATSTDARAMLGRLNNEDPKQFATLGPQLHLFLLACCRKNEHLTPQKILRDGVREKLKWYKGLITEDEFEYSSYHGEAEIFKIEYAKSREEIREIKSMVSGIKELKGMPFDQAKSLLVDAAYFVENSISYYEIYGGPFVNSLFDSQFLCADLLRKHVKPNFDKVGYRWWQLKGRFLN